MLLWLLDLNSLRIIIRSKLELIYGIACEISTNFFLFSFCFHLFKFLPCWVLHCFHLFLSSKGWLVVYQDDLKWFRLPQMFVVKFVKVCNGYWIFLVSFCYKMDCCMFDVWKYECSLILILYALLFLLCLNWIY